MDLCDDDQRNREMIQLSEFAVECGRSLRRLEAFRVAALGECTVRGGEICVDVRLK
jgi:hypothetical protein